MKKIYFKLIALSLTLAVSVTMVVAASYAWMILSSQPEVAGIQVTIGGRNTILVAADVTKTVEGVDYHYPDQFADSLNFSLYEQYDYLKELGSLMPVSTVDGINWFLPEYYDSTDEEVRNGTVAAGQLKDITEFTRENDLSHANQSPKSEELTEGHYIYLDFWVVSPGFDCTLRLSVPTVEGDNSGGTFLIEQMEAVSSGNGTTLVKGDGQAAAMARVGFLANSDMLVDNSMLHYVESDNFDDRFRSLRGWYSDPGDYAMNFDSQRFTIYEPNADLHPGGAAADGVYIPTEPIGLDNDKPVTKPVIDRVTAQCHSEWLTLADGSGTTILEQIFQSAIIGKSDLTPEKQADYFYDTYLQGQVEHYVSKGKFVKYYTNLSEGISLDQVTLAGATDEVYIVELQRNIPQRIRMFVWLEGQDADCVNLTDAASLMLNLELAGSTAEETTG